MTPIFGKPSSVHYRQQKSIPLTEIQPKKRRKEGNFTKKSSPREVRTYNRTPLGSKLAINKVLNMQYPMALKRYNKVLKSLNSRNDLSGQSTWTFSSEAREFVKQQETDLIRFRGIWIKTLEQVTRNCRICIENLQPTKDQIKLTKAKQDWVDLLINSQKLIVRIYHLSSFIKNQDQLELCVQSTYYHMMEQYNKLGKLQLELKNPHAAIRSFKTAECYIPLNISNKLEINLNILLDIIEAFSAIDDPDGICQEYQKHSTLLKKARWQSSFSPLITKIDNHYRRSTETIEIFLQLAQIKNELYSLFRTGDIDQLEKIYDENSFLFNKAEEHTYCRSSIESIEIFRKTSRGHTEKINRIHSHLENLQKKNSWNAILKVRDQEFDYISEMSNKLGYPIKIKAIKRIYVAALIAQREEKLKGNTPKINT